jgi:hypothetical protein
MKRPSYLLAITALAAAAYAERLHAYPLDGVEESGIRRLYGYQLLQESPTGAKLAPGAMLGSDDIELHLVAYDGPDFDEYEQDPELSAALDAMLRRRDPSYSFVLVDVSDPSDIRWAGLRADVRQNAGSVGKVICMIGLFDALARSFPEIEDRKRVLREAVSAAGDWVDREIHQVPKWDEEAQRNRFSVIRSPDEFRLSEWLDHAISASANGAGTMIWREAMLIRHFGAEYPVSEEVRRRFFAETPKSELSALARAVVTEPMIDAGIDTDNLQQGSFWTGVSKRKVPGMISYATPRELARVMFRLEQGQLVDEWSSLEMKKYLYMTKRRYRYVYAPELKDAAVFFKSGSLYSCKPEEEFRCDKYMGNVRNMMNSVTIVQGPTEQDPHYIAVLMSNVLKVNSAWDHSRIAAAVDSVVRTRQPQALRESASEKELSEAGKSE